MRGLSRKILGGLLLAGLIGILAGDPPVALGQKKKKIAETPAPAKDPYAGLTVKKVDIKGTLAPGKKLSATELAAHIDSLVSKRLKEEKAEPSALCTDEEFLRRAYLDITGKIPTADAAVKFLDSKESNKRAKLIDELLASKEYGAHMADIWQALLLPRNSDNRRLAQWYPQLVKYLETKFNENVSWDALTKEILTATGPVDKPSAVIYWLANPSADKVTDNVSRMFMGVQLQCAQCHNHPFTDYKQNEYWGMAAFFMKVRPDGNPKGAAKNGGSISISESAAAKGKRAGLPESAKILPPKFLQAEQPTVKGNDPLRPLLANWLATEKNPFFSKAMVNRLWSQYFGRGFVNPIDDMHDANQASHPELLVDMSQQFAANGFDVKYLIRAICNSETYQRSSKPAPGNADHGPELFARMAVKPLTPEQTYDSLTMIVGVGRQAAPKQKAAVARGAGNQREQFVAFFSAEDGADPTEYQAGIPQVLRLMNAPQLNNANALAPIMREAKSPGEVIEKLYLSVLSRRPTAEEVERIKKFLATSKEASQRDAYAGVLWALLNSSEFALNR